MPIKSCTLPDGGRGFKWGDSGKCYADRKDAERQAAAAYAHGYGRDGVDVSVNRPGFRDLSTSGVVTGEGEHR